MRPPPPDPTPADLEAAALAYLARFSASRVAVRRVLLRRLDRAAFRGAEVDREALLPAIEAVLDKLTRLGLLDDAAFAQGLATSLRNRGRSRRAVQHALAAKGVAAEVVEDALAEADADTEDPELTAARRLAQRRRLGPWRGPADRAERRERDLAALARAGFSYGIARRVIDEDPP